MNTSHILGIYGLVFSSTKSLSKLTERQGLIIQFVVDFQSTHGYSPSLQDIADKFRQSVSSIRQHLQLIERKGMIRLSRGKARCINVLQSCYSANERDHHRVPLIGKIAAGTPIWAEENIEVTILIPSEVSGGTEDFALRVQGDSMICAGILDGDIAVFSKQSQVENGEIAAVRVGNEATLKRVIKRMDRVLLKAENPKYEDITIMRDSGESVSIEGKLVGLLRSYK